MKQKFYLFFFILCMFLFPSRMLKAGILDELAYVNENTDLYIYINFSRIMNFLGSRGVKPEGIDSLITGDKGTETDKVIKQFGIMPGDLNEVIVAMHLQDTLEKSGYLVFISTKNGKAHIPEFYRKSPVKLKHGTAYRISEEDVFFTRIGDFLVMGSSAYIDSFLEKRSGNKNLLSQRSKQFRNKLPGKSVYIHLTVTEYLSKEMSSLLNSREVRGLSGNVFIRTLLTLDSGELAIELGDKVVFTAGMQGFKPEDSERLFMITNTWVVGSSILVPLADMFFSKTADTSIAESPDREFVIWLQRAFGRAHVRQVDKGVVSTFEVAPEVTDAVIAFINREIDNEKKARFGRMEREKTAKLTAAVKLNNFEEVKKYIKEKYNLNGFDTDGNTPLGTAASTGNVKIARFLIDNGAGINTANVDRLMPLHIAVKNGRKEMIVFLLGRGADVNAKADNELTPLHYNAIQGNSEITGILITGGAVVDALDADFSTPLHYASSMGFIKIVEVLSEKKADPLIRNRNKLRPVDIAERNNRDEIVGFFKSSFGLGPEYTDMEDDAHNEEFNMNADPADEITDEEE